jgi:hypothetical protein
MSREPRTVVFAGPALAGVPAEALAGFDLRPPARRGDVLTALTSEPHTLVLLDGYYYTVPAVAHKELLYALDAGVRLIGAASMGALRAAEMAPFGMEGTGWVFERFAAGELVGDDEVAVLHASAEHGYRLTSVALVEVRWALERLAEETALPGAAGLVEALAALPFVERDAARVAELAREGLGEEPAEALVRLLAADGIKRRDALAALALARRPAPRRPPSEARQTTYLSHFREWHLRPGPEPESAGFRQAWNVAQLLHPKAPGFVAAVRRRFLLASAARRAGIEPRGERWAELAAELEEAAPRLPEPERREEAAVAAAAEAALVRWGEEGAAAGWLAGELGLDRAADLLALLARQDDLLPPWDLVRAFAATPAFGPALAAAREALAIHRAFREWAEGLPVRRPELDALLADLWGCDPDDVPARAAARGLFPSHGFTPGLHDAAELIAPAERWLARGESGPVAGYGEARARLLRAPLPPPAGLPASGRRTGTAAAAPPPATRAPAASPR